MNVNVDTTRRSSRRDQNSPNQQSPSTGWKKILYTLPRRELARQLVKNAPIPKKFIDRLTTMVDTRLDDDVIYGNWTRHFVLTRSWSVHECAKSWIKKSFDNFSQSYYEDYKKIGKEDMESRTTVLLLGIAEILATGFHQVQSATFIKNERGTCAVGLTEKERTRFPTCHQALVEQAMPISGGSKQQPRRSLRLQSRIQSRSSRLPHRISRKPHRILRFGFDPGSSSKYRQNLGHSMTYQARRRSPVRKPSRRPLKPHMAPK